MRISPDELSQPISDDQPCGEDLEYDPAFQAIATLMQAHGEGVVEGGGAGDGGPDWKTVAEHATDLMGRTRDMRVFVYAATAGLNLDGVPTFHKALVALNNCLDAYWDTIHPQLDPDDDLDPTMRMNVLQNLTDFDNVRQGLWKCPLIELRGVGKFSLRDIDIAEGRESPAEGEEPVDAALIRGAFTEADATTLDELGTAVSGSIKELDRMLDIWAEKTNNWEAPSLEETRTMLQQLGQVISTYAPALAAAAEGGGDDAAISEGGGRAQAARSAPGTIGNRNDVLSAIDRICEYYSVNEPSSPVPLLLQRARGLVAKSFLEILEDIAPEGVSTAQQVAGKRE